MAMELRHGQTDQNFKETTRKAKSMKRDRIFGPMAANMQATGQRTEYQVQEYTTGWMVENMKGNG